MNSKVGHVGLVKSHAIEVKRKPVALRFVRDPEIQGLYLVEHEADIQAMEVLLFEDADAASIWRQLLPGNNWSGSVWTHGGGNGRKENQQFGIISWEVHYLFTS